MAATSVAVAAMASMESLCLRGTSFKEFKSLASSSSLMLPSPRLSVLTELLRIEAGETTRRETVKTWSSKYLENGLEEDLDGVFTLEDGIFEEAFPVPLDDTEAEDDGQVDSGLIPEQWRALQDDLSKTKKQKKKEVLDILLVRAKEKESQRRMRREKRDEGSEVYRQKFFPRVLPDDVSTSSIPEGSNEDGEDEDELRVLDDTEVDEPAAVLPTQRATPRNPRLALGKTTFEEMSRLLSVAEVIEEEPAEAASRYNDIESMEVSGSRLLTDEEKALLKLTELNISKISSEKWHPLHTFATSGQLNLVNLLLRRDFDINVQDMDGMTALHRAAIFNRDATVRFLVKSGADVKAADKGGATVLHYAVQTANTNVMKLVLRHKADINAQDNEGWTPLHVAVQGGRVDIVKLLVTRGADVNIKNKDGNSPLDVALSFGKGFGFYHVVKVLKRAPQLLLGRNEVGDLAVRILCELSSEKLTIYVAPDSRPLAGPTCRQGLAFELAQCSHHVTIY